MVAQRRGLCHGCFGVWSTPRTCLKLLTSSLYDAVHECEGLLELFFKPISYICLRVDSKSCWAQRSYGKRWQQNDLRKTKTTYLELLSFIPLCVWVQGFEQTSLLLHWILALWVAWKKIRVGGKPERCNPPQKYRWSVPVGSPANSGFPRCLLFFVEFLVRFLFAVGLNFCALGLTERVLWVGGIPEMCICLCLPNTLEFYPQHCNTWTFSCMLKLPWGNSWIFFLWNMLCSELSSTCEVSTGACKIPFKHSRTNFCWSTLKTFLPTQ